MEVDAKAEEEKKDESKKDTEEPKKDEAKTEEKKAEEKVEETKDDIVEIIDEKEKVVPEEIQEYDYIAKLEKFVKFINWDHTDAPYYLKEVRPKKVLSTEDQNEAMTKMLESFVANDGKQSFQSQQGGKMQQEQIRPQSPAMRQMGPKSTQQQQRGRPVQKRYVVSMCGRG